MIFDLLMVAPIALCGLATIIWAALFTITIPPAPGGPPSEPAPLDDLPPLFGTPTDWDDFNLRLEMWTLTQKELSA